MKRRVIFLAFILLFSLRPCARAGCAAGDKSCQYKEKDAALHKVLDDTARADKQAPIYKISVAIDESMHEYEKKELGPSAGSGESETPPNEKVAGELIKAVDSAMDTAALAGRMSIIKTQLERDPANEELKARKEEGSKQLGSVLAYEMPEEMYHPFIKKAAASLELIGFNLVDAAAAAGGHQPDAHSLELAGRGALQEGTLQGALKEFNRALALDPENARALEGRAVVRFRLGDQAAAALDAKAALALDPGNAAAESVLQLVSAGAGAAGGAALAQAQGSLGTEGGVSSSGPSSFSRDNTPGQADAVKAAQLARRAEISWQLRDFKTTADLASRALALDPQNVQAHVERARADNGLKLYDKALSEAVEGLRLAPKNPFLLRSKSYALNRLKDYKTALEAANLALLYDPRNAFVHANKAYALGALGDRKGMLAELRSAAAIDARFTPNLESALELPADGDVVFLFPGEIHATAGAQSPRAGFALGEPEVLRQLSGLGGLILLLGGAFLLAAVYRARSKGTTSIKTVKF